MAHRYNRGEGITLEHRNYEWGTSTLVDCDTGYPKITIWDPDGVMKTMDGEEPGPQVMTPSDGTGVYDFDYTIPADAKQGWWPYKIEARTGSTPTIDRDGFEVI